MSNHTEGSWKLVESSDVEYGLAVVMDDEVALEIAAVRTGNTSPKNALADGNLLAASPDLLDGCKAALAYFDEKWPGMDFGIPAQLRVAIAKATGETPAATLPAPATGGQADG